MNLKPALPRPVLALLAVLGVLFAIDLFALAEYRNLEQANEELRRQEQTLAALELIPALVLEMQSSVRGYLLTGDKFFLNRYRAAAESFPETAAKAGRLLVEDSPQWQRLREAEALVEKWLTTYLSPLVVKRVAGDDDRRTMDAILKAMQDGRGEALADRIRSQLDAALRAQATQVEQAHGRLQDELANVSHWMIGRGAALLISLAALALLLWYTLTRLSGVRGVLACQVRSRETAERATRENEALLRAMNDTSPLGVLVTDRSGACIYSNRAFERIAGLGGAALRGEGWQRALHPDDRDRVLAAWNAAIAIRAPFTSEHRFLHSSGQVSRVAMKAAAMNEGDQLFGFVCMAEDITELRDTGERLQQSEERLQLALERSQLALFDWHLPSGEIFLSRQWGSIIGETREPARTTARRLAELVHPKDRERLREAIIAALKGGSRPFRAEFRIRSRGDQWKRVRSHGQVTERDSVSRAVRLTGTVAAED